MSSSPFESVMRSRAAFAPGQHETDVVSGIDQARYSTFGDYSQQDIQGQPPLSQGREQSLSLKVQAPPLSSLTLDFTKTDVNAAGVLRRAALQDGALKAPGESRGSGEVQINSIAFAPEPLNFAPETAALKAPPKAEATSNSQLEATLAAATDARTPETTLVKRTPALTFAEFGAIDRDLAKFANASYDLSMKPNGTIEHKYTAADFTTCTMSSNNGVISAVVKDSYARPTAQQSIDAEGRSTVTRYAYDDSSGRKAMFASAKEVTNPDGTVQNFSYDRFGKAVLV